MTVDATIANSRRVEARFNGGVGEFLLDVEFDLPMDGTTCVFGASGSGKTTLLRCVAGLVTVPGRLRVGSEVWQDTQAKVFRKTHQRRLGYVFQEASLFPHLSVRRNLLYATRRAPKTVGQSQYFDEIVTLLGLRSIINRATTELSGGERQRVAIGRALLSRPTLLLMDEPLVALDRDAKEEILPYLERLPAELAIPMLYVSHDISEVTRLADRMLLLSKGRVVAAGELNEMLERLDLQPATGRFEASTILSARVVEQDEKYMLTTLDLNGQKIVIPGLGMEIGAEFRLRVRARDVTLATERPRHVSIRNTLTGKVVEIREEPHSAFAETLIDVGAGRLRARITRASVDDLNLRVGDPIYALIKSISFDRRTRI